MIQKGFILTSTFLSLVLVGCNIISHPDPTPTPTTIPLASSELPVLEGKNVVASGEIVPARFVHLGFDQNGSVERVDGPPGCNQREGFRLDRDILRG